MAHGKRCAAAKSPRKRCSCMCRGRSHGAAHSTDRGLLRYVRGLLRYGKRETA